MENKLHNCECGCGEGSHCGDDCKCKEGIKVAGERERDKEYPCWFCQDMCSALTAQEHGMNLWSYEWDSPYHLDCWAKAYIDGNKEAEIIYENEIKNEPMVKRQADILVATLQGKTWKDALDFKFEVIGEELSEEEARHYIEHVNAKNSLAQLESLTIKVDGEFVDLDYKFYPVKFERIRRITGYLVGTVDRFNNAKTAEVHDRVKHGVATQMEQI